MTQQKKLFCPFCYSPLDINNSCWIPCEYESNETYPPYNEMQALNSLLLIEEIRLKATLKKVENIMLEIARFKSRIDEIKEAPTHKIQA